MAHFIGGVEGNRGPASRLGSAKSGIEAYARGWDIGALIRCWVDENGRDIVSISLTSGSNGRELSKCLGDWYRTKDGYEKIGG